MGQNHQFDNLNKTVANNAIQPNHYCKHKHDPLSMCMEWGLDFPLGNVIKYVVRAGHKAGNSEIQDLKKAKEYLDRKIKFLEESQTDGYAD